MNILFTICGRAGSKGFKNKNLKEMSGVPLAYYTLAAIYEYKTINPSHNITVALNSDSEELMNLMSAQNIIPVTIVPRKPDLAGDYAAKVDVIKDTYNYCKGIHPDLVIDLDITSPLRRVKDIENIIETYNSGTYDLVFSVVKSRRSPYFNMVEEKEDGYYRKICYSSYTARQQAPKTYELNASIYAYKPQFLSGEITKTILDYNCGIVEMQDYYVLDIDSEEDFQAMQFIFEMLCKSDEDLLLLYERAKLFVRARE